MASPRSQHPAPDIDPYKAFREGRITYSSYREHKRILDARPKNKLCSICQQIKIQKLYGGARVDDAGRAALGVVLGTYEQISARALYCVFCRWIIRNTEYHPSYQLQYPGTRKIKLCCDGSTVYDGREQRPESVNGFLIPIVRLRIEPYRLHEDIFADLRLVRKPDPGAGLSEPLTEA